MSASPPSTVVRGPSREAETPLGIAADSAPIANAATSRPLPPFESPYSSDNSGRSGVSAA